MAALSDKDLKQFWLAVLHYIKQLYTYAGQSGEWQKAAHFQEMLGDIEAIAQNGTLWTARTEWLLDNIIIICRENIRGQDGELCAHLLEIADSLCQIAQAHEHQGLNDKTDALARRLFQLHQFMEGKTGVEDFGVIQYHDDDMKYGLGLSLRNGELFRLFTNIQSAEQADLVERYFGDDSAGLQNAISEGQVSFEEYLRSQLILTYDPALSKKRYLFPAHWQSCFELFGTDPVVKKNQVKMVAGNRFCTTQGNARKSGIRSLRGFAMLFDLEDLATDSVVDAAKCDDSEPGKCLTLADEVLSKMHGHLANHWQSRLHSVFTGHGSVDGRRYDESQFWGNISGENDWDEVDFSDYQNIYSATPQEGKIYTICTGDRLETLAGQVYGSEANVRDILKQNPQIRHPGDFRPGTKIFFPNRNHTNLQISKKIQAAWNETSDKIVLNEREIGPLTFLKEEQKKSFFDTLTQIPDYQRVQAKAVDLHPGIAIVCGMVTLWIFEDDLNTIRPEVVQWAYQIAAQIRGDIDLGDGKYLPFAYIPSQPHRRSWAERILRKERNNKGEKPIIAIHARDKYVDIMGNTNEVYVRLENEDFYAIRMQPARRLRDYVAPPIVQMNDLAQLWVYDYINIPAEIAVPPMSSANQYTIQQTDNQTVIGLPMGTPVYPIMKGKVVDAGRTMNGSGFMQAFFVLIQHPGGLMCRYSGLSTVCVHTGQIVDAETMVARSGDGGMDAENGPGLVVQCYQIKKDEDESDHSDMLDYFEVICRLWTDGEKLISVMGDKYE